MPALDNIGTTTTTTTVKVSLGLPAGLTPAELLYVALLLSLVLMLGMLAGLLFFLYVVDFRSASCPRTGHNLHLPHCCLQTHTDLESDSGPNCEHCRACVAIAAWRDGRDCALRNLQQHFPNTSIQIADEKIPDGEDMGPYSA